MATIKCDRCTEDKEQIDEAPMGGPLGEKILETICTDCWGEWRTMSGNLINHHGLNLGLPEHRTQLRGAMKEFLGLEAKT